MPNDLRHVWGLTIEAGVLVRHISFELTKIGQFEHVIDPVWNTSTDCAADTVGICGRTATTRIRRPSRHVSHSIVGNIDVRFWRNWTLVPFPFIVVIVATKLSPTGDENQHWPKE